jgi:hypothetical protein
MKPHCPLHVHAVMIEESSLVPVFSKACGRDSGYRPERLKRKIYRCPIKGCVQVHSGYTDFERVISEEDKLRISEFTDGKVESCD